MRKPPAVVALLVLLLALTCRSAVAAPDELMPCKIFKMKVDKDATNVANVKFLCKAPPGGFAIPDATNSPTPNLMGGTGFGASMLMRDLGSGFYIIPGHGLPASGWVGLGNPPGSKGFRFRDKQNYYSCRSIKVTAKQVSGECRSATGPNVVLPAVGDIGMSIYFHGIPYENGKTYCAQFSGTEARNDAGVLIRKDSPAPAVCPTLM